MAKNSSAGNSYYYSSFEFLLNVKRGVRLGALGSLTVSVLYFMEYMINNEYCTEESHYSRNIDGS
jgi:hypothetical protein